MERKEWLKILYSLHDKGDALIKSEGKRRGNRGGKISFDVPAKDFGESCCKHYEALGFKCSFDGLNVIVEW